MAGKSGTPSNPLPEDWLASVAPETRRQEATALLQLFGAATGYQPRLWAGGIVGFGRYAYRYDSGHAGESLATGFAPRKAELSIYILPGYADFGSILARLGRHKLGKSCLYVKRLSDIDIEALADLIKAGLGDLSQKWAIHPV